METRLAHLKLEEQESLIQKATLDDVKTFDAKARFIIHRAAPYEDSFQPCARLVGEQERSILRRRLIASRRWFFVGVAVMALNIMLTLQGRIEGAMAVLANTFFLVLVMGLGVRFFQCSSRYRSPTGE